jgi:hypothetical protein
MTRSPVAAAPPSPLLSAEHVEFQAVCRKFVRDRVSPLLAEAGNNQMFPDRHGSDTWESISDDCFARADRVVEEARRGLYQFMEAFQGERIGQASEVGLAEAASRPPPNTPARGSSSGPLSRVCKQSGTLWPARSLRLKPPACSRIRRPC